VALSPSSPGWNDSARMTPPSFGSSLVGPTASFRFLPPHTEPAAAGAAAAPSSSSSAPRAATLTQLRRDHPAPPEPGPLLFEIDGRLYDTQGREVDAQPAPPSACAAHDAESGGEEAEEAEEEEEEEAEPTLRDAALAAAAAALGLHALPEPAFRRQQRMQQQVRAVQRMQQSFEPCRERSARARQRMVLERGTNPKRSRRTCTCEYALQSRGAKRRV
jgi:hypothetical protein